MTNAKTPQPEIADLGLVGYDYFAQELNVRPSTIRTYANGTEKQRLIDFPLPVTGPNSRQPLFRKEAADTFISNRRAGSTTGKGRVKPATLTKTQRTALQAAAATLGHEIKLDDRRAVREAIYGELDLPVITITKNEQLPAVDTPTIKKLYKQTEHPFLHHLLTYRGIDTPTTTS
ncbi:hypothetical protein DC31_06415 [Microbacterium sp. CH12i]|uniref:hypothetical protein n=1 Tax=Microbacterium sp. CH12i TaxID=1479651 RepID=UPI0004613278|nr:hypothetical protein [Microbacterium sp. CH12i]KDA04532.1 hypothetical protein DC31_06415 [Microbacterium sp. CH12i]